MVKTEIHLLKEAFRIERAFERRQTVLQQTKNNLHLLIFPLFNGFTAFATAAVFRRRMCQPRIRPEYVIEMAVIVQPKLQLGQLGPLRVRMASNLDKILIHSNLDDNIRKLEATLYLSCYRCPPRAVLSKTSQCFSA